MKKTTSTPPNKSSTERRTASRPTGTGTGPRPGNKPPASSTYYRPTASSASADGLKLDFAWGIKIHENEDEDRAAKEAVEATLRNELEKLGKTHGSHIAQLDKYVKTP
jgi:hypothetical protein